MSKEEAVKHWQSPFIFRKNMKIALIHYTAPPVVGGVESYILAQARMFVEAEHKVHIFAGRGDVQERGVKFTLIPLLDSMHPQVLTLKTQLDKAHISPLFDEVSESIFQELLVHCADIDVLIAHNVCSLHKNLALTAALYRLSLQNQALKLILWHHDLAWVSDKYQAELYDFYPWNLLRKAWSNAVNVTISRFRKAQLASLFNINPDQVSVIPPGVDWDRFLRLTPQTLRLTTLMNLGAKYPILLQPIRITQRKNIELSLEILGHLKQILPNIALIVTGPEGAHNPKNTEYKAKLIELRRQLGLEKTVYFAAEYSSQPLSEWVVGDFYRIADAILLTSTEEGFGLPLIEAAYSKTPVFCSHLDVFHEIGEEDISYFRLDASPIDIAYMIASKLGRNAPTRFGIRARQDYYWNAVYRTRIGPMLEALTQNSK